MTEPNNIADTPHGSIMELFFLDKGRQFLQEAFQDKLQERVKQVETTTEHVYFIERSPFNGTTRFDGSEIRREH